MTHVANMFAHRVVYLTTDAMPPFLSGEYCAGCGSARGHVITRQAHYRLRCACFSFGWRYRLARSHLLQATASTTVRSATSPRVSKPVASP